MSDDDKEVVTGEVVEQSTDDSPTVQTTPPVESEEVVNLRKEVSGLKSAASNERHKRQIAEAEATRLRTPQEPETEGLTADKVNQIFDKRSAEQNAQAQQIEADKLWDERIEKGQKAHPDVDVAGIIQDETFYPYVSDAMADVIRNSDDGVDLMLHLHTNREELQRIAQLSPYQAAQQMGRISEQIKSSGKAKISNASDPITPVGSRSVSEKDPDDMSWKEYDSWIKEKNNGSAFPQRR